MPVAARVQLAPRPVCVSPAVALGREVHVAPLFRGSQGTVAVLRGGEVRQEMLLRAWLQTSWDEALGGKRRYLGGAVTHIGPTAGQGPA